MAATTTTHPDGTTDVVKKVSDPNFTNQSVHYDASKTVTGITDKRADGTLYYTYVKQADGTTITTSYDATGTPSLRVTRFADGRSEQYGVVTGTYYASYDNIWDALGSLLSSTKRRADGTLLSTWVKSPDGTITQTSYDAAGNPVSTVVTPPPHGAKAAAAPPLAAAAPSSRATASLAVQPALSTGNTATRPGLFASTVTLPTKSVVRAQGTASVAATPGSVAVAVAALDSDDLAWPDAAAQGPVLAGEDEAPPVLPENLQRPAAPAKNPGSLMSSAAPSREHLVEALFLNGIMLSQLATRKARPARQSNTRQSLLTFDPLCDRFDDLDGAALDMDDLPHVADSSHEKADWVGM